MSTTNIQLEFPDDRTRDDFEIAFRGWLKQYQQQVSVVRALRGAGGSKESGEGGSSGLQSSSPGGSGGHSYGTKDGSSGLIEGGTIHIPIFGDISFDYLNFIGGW